jgi:para-nitrobenzyl esterase
MRRMLGGVLLCAMVAAPAAVTAAIPARVTIDTGDVAGTTGMDSGVRVFKGIPFAAPPVGENRWRAPQPVTPWDGARDASRFGPRCMQRSFGGPNTDQPATSEDCLYLNVWTTADSADDQRPVMVWIYGGGFSGGAGSEPRYDGEGLAKKGAVVVTLNYRLGPFGFFAHPQLSKESAHGASGNYGMMDALAALRWVQRNIAVFGGDPDNVTVFGESAGAIMTAALVGSPQAKGLFHRAISESGAWMGLGLARMGTLADAEQAGVEAAETLGAHTLAALRDTPADELLQKVRGGGLVVDGDVIPEDLSLTFAAGRQNPVDVLVGSNRDEATFFSRGDTKAEPFKTRAQQRFGAMSAAFLDLYPAATDAQANESFLASFSDEAAWHMRTFAKLQAEQGENAFVYYFTHVPPAAPGRPSRGATHTAELAYVFNHLPDGRAWTDTDRELADTMSSFWVNFARSGDPNGKGLPQWPKYGSNGGRALILGDDVHPEPSPMPSAAKLAFFDSAYAHQMQGLK